MTPVSSNAWKVGVCKTALAAFLFLCCAAQPPLAHASKITSPEVKTQLLNYCERFARTVPNTKTEDAPYSYLADSAKLKKSLGITTFVNNFFQPADSRFSGAYRCRFKLAKSTMVNCLAKVDLLLVENREFAEHTQWPGLALVSPNTVHDKSGRVLFYIVPKYYDLQCP